MAFLTYNYLPNTIFCSNFVSSNEKLRNMEQRMELMEITPEEKELLERLRNYNRSYPNGYPQLLWDLQELFDSMVRQPYD